MPSTAVGTTFRQVARAVLEFLPCGPRSIPQDDGAPAELGRRTAGLAGTAPRRSFTPPLHDAQPSYDADDLSDWSEGEDAPRSELNLRRMRLQRTDDGGMTLKQLKFVDQSSSSHPERERQRQIEDDPQLARDLRPRLVPMSAGQRATGRQFELRENHDVKAVGFNYHGPATTTGTSKPGVLCVTDRMGPCIALALAAEKIAEDGVTRLPGAKARVFHVHPMATGVEPALRERIEGYQEKGLTVRAAMHGGWHMSESRSEELRATLQALSVPLAFDESSLQRLGRNTPLGAVVQDDHTVRFATELLYRP